MTEFKVGDKVRVKTISYDPAVEVGSIHVIKRVMVSPAIYPFVICQDDEEYTFSAGELELVTAAPEDKDVWEWLVEQSYLSEHDAGNARAEYEAFHKGVDALPTEVGWYESGVFPLRDGWNPYRLEWGIWYQMTDDGLEEISHEEALEFMPLTKLGAEASEVQA